MARGRVKWFDGKKGYGFIADVEGDPDRDIFVHFTMIEGTGYRALQCGEQVEFVVRDGPKGLSALGVHRIGAEAG